MERIELNGMVYEFEDGIALMALLDENADCVRESVSSPPNTPLTIDQLREMDGEPVFVNLDSGYWGIVDCEESVVAMPGHGVLPFAVSGGRCYRRKPEEGT